MALNRALVMLGPPGAGKGTQARLIAKTFGVPHLSTGDMFREAISRGTKIGRLAKPIMERGDLVPDDVVMKMVEERLRQSDSAGGVVLDGFPRTLPQAEKLDQALGRLGFGKPIVIDIQLEPETLVRRLSGRRTCSIGGEIYNVHELPPKVPEVCDKDGGELVQRSDDRPEVIRQRLLAYEFQTKPLSDYYLRHGVLKVVDGSANIDKVSCAITKFLEGVAGRDGHL
jgi:adenylate kinase